MKLKDITKKESFPLLRINDTLDVLQGSKWISILYIYVWWFLAGRLNASGNFEALMELVLRELNWKIWLVYLEDVVNTGRNLMTIFQLSSKFLQN